MGPRRRVIQVSNLQNTAVNVAAASWTNVDLLGNAPGGLSTDAGLTVVRTRLVITPTTAPVLNDKYRIAVGAGRNGDIGAATGINPTITNLPWAFIEGFTFNGGLTRGGGNIITISSRRRFTVRDDYNSWILSIQNDTGGALTYTVWSRVVCLMP